MLAINRQRAGHDQRLVRRVVHMQRCHKRLSRKQYSALLMVHTRQSNCNIVYDLLMHPQLRTCLKPLANIHWMQQRQLCW